MPNDGYSYSCPHDWGDAGNDGDSEDDDIILCSSHNESPKPGCLLFHCYDGCNRGKYLLVVGHMYKGTSEYETSPTAMHSFLCDYNEGDWVSAQNAIEWCDNSIGGLFSLSDLNSKGLKFVVRNKSDLNTDVFTASASSGAYAIGNIIQNDHCKGYYCKNSTDTWDSAQEKCVQDTTVAQQTCRDSYGQWDATNSKCLCGDTDRTDGKGDGQEYAKPNVSCKCSNPSHEWNDADGKCVDPNVGDADACDKSGGEWKDGECKCDENSRGLKPVSGDKTCECIDNNKKYSQSDKMCVLTDQANCENTGGEWDDKKQTCTCDSKKNIKQEPSNQKVCICKNDDYGPDPTVKGCELTQDAKERRTDFENLKESCEKWDGAKWFPETWERELSNGKENENWEPKKWKCTCNPSGGQISADNDRSCVCDIGKGYYLKSKNSPYRCEQTDCATLQKKCNSSIGGGTRYIDECTASGRQICDCKCNDDKKVYSLAENMCIDAPIPIQDLCDMVKPANSAMIDKDNNCVCISTGRRPENGKCPPAANSGSASGGGASASLTPSSDDINKAKEKVSAAYKELKQIEFEKSHWKTASGNFNGARLASDSIAGVVLGTVGGVVTSNVIKKNQVKGGFENLQCTVGGQMVADYGVQFQVGIR